MFTAHSSCQKKKSIAYLYLHVFTVCLENSRQVDYEHPEELLYICNGYTEEYNQNASSTLHRVALKFDFRAQCEDS